MDKILKQMAFLTEIDKLKNVSRKGRLTDGSRFENTAEHSWHLALMTMVLSEHAGNDYDLFKVLKLSLVHDIVEIDAGDTFAYDETGYEDKHDRELQAAERIFGLLPDEQNYEYHELWKEYEFGDSKEAIVARAFDRFIPVLLHDSNGHKTWEEHKLTKTQVVDKVFELKEVAPDLWPFFMSIVQKAVATGKLIDQ